MRPIEFKEQTTVYAKNQPEYLTLPAHVDADGVVTSCWELSWRERFAMLFQGRLWLSAMTFRGSPQPLLPSTTWSAGEEP